MIVDTGGGVPNNNTYIIASKAKSIYERVKILPLNKNFVLQPSEFLDQIIPIFALRQFAVYFNYYSPHKYIAIGS